VAGGLQPPSGLIKKVTGEHEPIRRRRNGRAGPGKDARWPAQTSGTGLCPFRTGVVFCARGTARSPRICRLPRPADRPRGRSAAALRRVTGASLPGSPAGRAEAPPAGTSLIPRQSAPPGQPGCPSGGSSPEPAAAGVTDQPGCADPGRPPGRPGCPQPGSDTGSRPRGRPRRRPGCADPAAGPTGQPGVSNRRARTPGRVPGRSIPRSARCHDPAAVPPASRMPLPWGSSPESAAAGVSRVSRAALTRLGRPVKCPPGEPFRGAGRYERLLGRPAPLARGHPRVGGQVGGCRRVTRFGPAQESTRGWYRAAPLSAGRLGSSVDPADWFHERQCVASLLLSCRTAFV
jgi:hypothetical protein